MLAACRLGTGALAASRGGGNYTTVKRYLDQWREAALKQRQPEELPEPAVARLMSLGREFWGLLDEQAGQQVAALRKEIAAIQTQLDRAEQALREAVAARTERMAAAEAKAGELTVRVEDLKDELGRACARQTAEHEAATVARESAAVVAARLQGELTALQERMAYRHAL